MNGVAPSTRPSPGRPLSSSRGEIEAAAFDLFQQRGFDGTSVDDIAAAVGIGRRTFFRYFASKADVVWGDFDEGLDNMRRHLGAVAADVPLLRAVRSAVLDFNAVPPEQLAWHRRRMTLILGEPTLLAGSTLRFRNWRAVIAEFVGDRQGLPPDDVVPVMAGYSALGCSLAAYEQWLARPGSDLVALLGETWDALESGFADPGRPRPRQGSGKRAR